MNINQFETHWNQLRSLILSKWSRLTEEDLRQINGNYELFVSKVQQKYGYTREQVEEEFRRWQPDLRGEREPKSALARWLPWLLLALALLFLLNYLGNRDMDTTRNTPPRVTSQEAYPTTPRTDVNSRTDTTVINPQIIQSIRDNLAREPNLLSALTNIRVEIDKGVVTLHGSIPTAQQKERITNIVERVPGVVRVDNQLQVQE